MTLRSTITSALPVLRMDRGTAVRRQPAPYGMPRGT